jgi:hypothetical protein
MAEGVAKNENSASTGLEAGVAKILIVREFALGQPTLVHDQPFETVRKRRRFASSIMEKEVLVWCVKAATTATPPVIGSMGISLKSSHQQPWLARRKARVSHFRFVG